MRLNNTDRQLRLENRIGLIQVGSQQSVRFLWGALCKRDISALQTPPTRASVRFRTIGAVNQRQMRLAEYAYDILHDLSENRSYRTE